MHDYPDSEDLLHKTIRIEELPHLAMGFSNLVAQRDREDIEACEARYQIPFACNFSEIEPHFNRNEYQQVAEELRRLGVRRIKFDPENGHGLKGGSYSIVAQICDTGQILRISQKHVEDRLYNEAPPFLLKPLHRFECGSLQVEIYPQVNLEDVSVVDCLAIDQIARAMGYVFYDMGVGNIGKLQDGTPIVIDPGCIAEVGKLQAPINIKMFYPQADDKKTHARSHSVGSHYISSKDKMLHEHGVEGMYSKAIDEIGHLDFYKNAPESVREEWMQDIKSHIHSYDYAEPAVYHPDLIEGIAQHYRESMNHHLEKFGQAFGTIEPGKVNGGLSDEQLLSLTPTLRSIISQHGLNRKQFEAISYNAMQRFADSEDATDWRTFLESEAIAAVSRERKL